MLGGSAGSLRHATAARQARSRAAPRTLAVTARASAAKEPPVRRLILLRHADSISSSTVRDHDRPISHQGKREAASVAAKLRSAGWVPDLVLASNSKRTKQTLDHMSEVLTELSDADAHYLGSLYSVAALDGQTRQHIQECLAEILQPPAASSSSAASAGAAALPDDKYRTIMLVGHNKGWEEAASSFARQAVRLKTASAALLEAAGASWGDILNDDTEWRLVQVLQP